MVAWWVADAWALNPIFLISWVIWVIASITLHELAHGWTAIRCGDRTPILTGHMTWNPVVHMGQWSLIMFAAIGIAWGAMPVNPANFRGRYDDAKVALAGPMMNLLLFAIALIGAAVVVVFAPRIGDPLADNLFLCAKAGAFLNLALMLFNLIPVPPLDGYRIVANLVPAFERTWQSPNAMLVANGAMLAAFWFGGPWVFSHSMQWTIAALDALLRAIGQGHNIP